MFKHQIKKLTKNNKMNHAQQAKHAKKMARNGKTFLYHPELNDSHHPVNQLKPKEHDIHDWCDEHDCIGTKSPKRIKE
jgi:hypothetical protein